MFREQLDRRALAFVVQIQIQGVAGSDLAFAYFADIAATICRSQSRGSGRGSVVVPTGEPQAWHWLAPLAVQTSAFAASSVKLAPTETA